MALFPGRGALLPTGGAPRPGGLARRVLFGQAVLASAAGCASPASAAYLRTAALTQDGSDEIGTQDQVAAGVRLEEDALLTREAAQVIDTRDLVLNSKAQDRARVQEKLVALEEDRLEDDGQKVMLVRGDDQRFLRRDRAMRLGGVAATLQALKDEFGIKM